MKKIMKSILIIAVAMVMVINVPKFMGNVRASDDIQVNQVIFIDADTYVMDIDSNVIASLSSGTGVIVCELPQNGWVKVKHQDIVGYISLDVLKSEYFDKELAQEFEGISNDNMLLFEKIEYENSIKRQKIIWGIVIAVLAIAMFVAGLVGRLGNKKKMERTEKANETDNTDTML